MDRSGIATAIQSVAEPAVHLGDRKLASSLARRLNEHMARMQSDRPDRFGTFAVLPMPQVDATLVEIEHSLDVLGADGVGLLTCYDGRYLGDPAFEAVFAELDRRRAVVFVHPTLAKGAVADLPIPGAIYEFVFDTTRAVANLIYSGTLERYPNVSIILPHAGGTVPYLAWRLTLGRLSPALDANAPQGAIAYLKRLYYETALSASPYAFASLDALVDRSQILFGSDIPFLPEPGVRESVSAIAEYARFDAEARRAIERDNALALFPRLRDLHQPVAAARAIGGAS
jgi:predicted TIM-barrel fold metal-dependent hydrolase